MRRTALANLLATCLLALAAPAALAQRQPTPLIPREVLFGNPARAQVRLSPDGSRLSFLAPLDGVLNVWIAPAEEPDAARALTCLDQRPVREHSWAADGRHVLYLTDARGEEDWVLWAADSETGVSRRLTPEENVQARIIDINPRFPGEVVVALNQRDPRVHDLHIADLLTGQLRPLAVAPEETAAWTLAPDRRHALVTRLTRRGGAELLLIDLTAEQQTPRPWLEIPPEDLLTTSVLGFAPDGAAVYLRDSRERDTAALAEVPLDRPSARRILAADPAADLDMVLVHPLTGEAQAATFTRLRARWQAVAASHEDDLMRLAEAHQGELLILSRSHDLSRWLVAYSDDDGPTGYYLYRRPAGDNPGELRFLFHQRPALAEVELAPMLPLVVPARDRLDLTAYLTLPPWVDRSAAGVPDSPLPMVLLVHGGPWSRDRWGYEPVHQLLANRGYAVLSVNFRGSTGFGKAFVNAADREWGGKMQDDLVDAVRWAVERGVADARRVAIMGASYGGYAALVGMTRDSELFACGIDVVGPSSLVTLLRSIPPYREPMRALWRTRVGDPDAPEDQVFLRLRSPITWVDQISRPLLIAHGANDPRVKQSESDRIFERLERRNIPVTYLLFPDEGHGFRRPENNLAFLALAEQFLAKHLGGRAEPVGEALERSSAVVRGCCASPD